MSEIIAGAFVRVQAELIKGFRKDLSDQIKKGIGPNAIKVPVKIDVAPFRQAVQRELRRTPFGVPIKPEISITKFRSELQKKVNQAARGVVARVDIQTGAVSSGGRRGGTGAGGVEGTRRAATEAAITAASAEKLYKKALDDTLTSEQRAQRLLIASADVRKGLRAAVREGNVEEERAFTTLQDRIKGQRQLQDGLKRTGLLEEDFAETQRKATTALATDITKITERSKLTKLSNDLTKQSNSLKALEKRASELNAAAIELETKALQQQIVTRRQDIERRARDLASGAERRRQLGQAGRGGLAQGLSALGARGATLAAGSEFLIGAAAVTISAAAIKSAADLESELNVLRVTARATATEMRAVGEESIKLGRDVTLPGVSAGDAAKSMNSLVRAGLSVEDAIDGARGTLQLATAAQIDFSEASNLVASALNAFSLSGNEAVHVADLLTNASNESQAEITTMGVALQQAAGAASAVGVGLEDTVALLTLLSRAGLSGSDAGTSLRTAFIRLVNPTKKAADVIKQLELNIRNSQGQVRPEVFGEFEEATRNLTAAERDRARAIVFGQDAFRASALAGREGIVGLRQIQVELDRQGAAAELAGARAVGLAGKISALQSNIETLGTTLGSITLGPLSSFVGGINDLVQTANQGAIAIQRLTGFVGDLATSFRNVLPGPVREGLSFLGDIGTDFLGPAAGFTFSAKQIQKFAGLFGEEAEKIQGDAKETAKQVEAFLASFGEGPLEVTAIQSAITGLDEMADKLAGGDAEAQRLAAAIREVIKEITKTQRLPATTIDFQLRFDRNQIEKSATEAEKILITHFQGLAPAFQPLGALYIGNLEKGMKDAIETIDLGGGGLSRATRTALAEVEGDVDAQLALLRERLATTTRTRIRQQQLVSSGARPDLADELKATIAQEKALQDEIQSILDDRKNAAEDAARDAKQAADDAADAREKLDQAVLDAFELNRTRAQNKITIAQATAGLDDDIKATAFLKRLVKLQIARLRERVKTAELRNAAFRELQQILFGLDRDLEALRKERRQTMRDEVRRGIELDIEFAETTENRNLEVRARRRLINSLQKEIDEILKQKKLTIEQKNRLKELRNEIAEQRKELGELKKETESNITAQQQFAFLQAQAGFAANLLGNLIPSNLTGGLVGGSGGARGTTGVTEETGFPSIPRGPEHFADGRSLPGRRPQDSAERTRQLASATGGPTRGGQASQTEVLNKILRVLIDIRRGTTHPQAVNVRRRSHAAMETGGGGSMPQ